MKRLLFVLVAAALLAPAALAKGPSQATVTGPGLGKTISFKGSGEAGGTALGNLTEYSGFFPAVFGQSPNPMLKGRPVGKLGATFTIHYLVPGGDAQGHAKTYRITQLLYPYAIGGAVTYMRPGQAIFGRKTIGGWYPAGEALKQMLVRGGLPKSAPGGSSGTNLALVAGIGIPGALVLAGAALLVARRRSRG
jgi:opacity protein-like surface antigen